MKTRFAFLAIFLVGVFSFGSSVVYALPLSFIKDGWLDVNKYHNDGDDASWTQNNYNDDGDGIWEPSEEWTDENNKFPDPGWNIRTAADNSCWMASASNMLAYRVEMDVLEVYDEILGYGEAGDSDFYWTNGGFQHIAIEKYLEQNSLEDYYSVHAYHSDGHFEGWVSDPFSFVQMELYRCETVGLGFYFPGDGGHAITLWGWDKNYIYFTDSDQGELMLHDVQYKSDGGSFSINYNNDGKTFLDIAYISTFSPVPEPATLLLFGVGIIGFVPILKKRANRHKVGS